MWFQIQLFEPIWFFDGTGSINKKLPDQNDSHFFSVIAHDKVNKKLMPIFEFVSTDHTASQLSFFLEKALICIESAIGIKKDHILVPPVIVVDFSYAMINSVLKAYNNCSLQKYLEWTYEILVMNNNHTSILGIMNTRVNLCATHFLKNIIDKAKFIKDNKINIVYKTFIYSFTLLQNSTSLNEFENFLFHIYKKSMINKIDKSNN